MKRFWAPIFVGALTLTMLFGRAFAQEVDGESMLPSVQVMSCGTQCANFVPAKPPKDRELPKFPRSVSGLHPYAEGWIWLRYTIGKDGKARDISPIYVIGPQAFADNFAEKIKEWSFEPAKLNGTPVEQTAQYRLTYHATSRVSGARLNVEDLIKEALELDKAGKLAEIRPRLEDTFRVPYLSFSERSMLAFPLALLAIQRKDYFEARRLALLGTMMLPVPRIVAGGLWQIRISTDLYLGEIFDAENAASYIGGDRELPILKTLSATHARTGSLPQQTVHAIIPDVAESSVYWHVLDRRTFGFHIVSGSLDKFVLGCRSNMIESKITETAQWKIPESWGGCTLFVYGAPGAKFDFIEASDVSAPSGQIDAKYDADVRAHPDSVVAYLARGWARRSNGASKETLADFDKAVALDPKMPDAYRARYSVALEGSDFAAAEADSNTVIALEDKDDIRGYYMRGLLRQAAGRYDEALADFDKAESQVANTELIALERAITLFCLERYTDASYTLSRYYHGIYPPFAQAWVHVLSTKNGTKENWSAKQYEPDLGWTSRLFGLYRGQKTVAEIEADMAAAKNDPVRKSYWSCDARFFLAEYRLEHGDVAGARAGLTDLTPASCPSVVGPARAELRRLPVN